MCLSCFKAGSEFLSALFALVLHSNLMSGTLFSACVCTCAVVVRHFPFIFAPLEKNKPALFRNDLTALDLRLMFAGTTTKRCI